jgi:hypothetical protein
VAKTVVRDQKREIEAVATELMAQYQPFGVLSAVNILFVWRLGETPRYDDQGRPIAATTRRLPVRERDVYGFDVEVEVFQQAWGKKGPKARRRLIWHELYKIDVEQGEDFKVNHDDDGRVIVTMREHDVAITTFEEELKQFGLSSRDIADAQVITKALKRFKLRKYKDHSENEKDKATDNA